MSHFLLAQTTTIGEALQRGSAHLRKVGIGSGNIEAAMLLSMVTGLDRLGLINYMTRELSTQEHDAFVALINRRGTREPLQHITGSVEFMGLEFEVSPEVLIPRPDTEILVEAILDVEEEVGQRDGVLVADVGTGSGAIAVSLASYLQYARVLAVELSPEAAAIARRNIARHDVGDRVELLLGDGLAPLAPHAGKLAILVSNPPYIAEADLAELEPEVRDYEPRLALTPGADPYVWYRRFAAEAPDLLQPGGLLAVEVGIHQAAEVLRLLEADGRWTDLAVHKDLGGIERAILARTKA